MRLLTTTILLMVLGIFSSDAQSVSISPEDVTFVYPSTGFSRSAAAFQHSLAALLEPDAPPYVRSIVQNLRRSAAAAAILENLPVDFFINLIQQESSFQK